MQTKKTGDWSVWVCVRVRILGSATPRPCTENRKRWKKNTREQRQQSSVINSKNNDSSSLSRPLLFLEPALARHMHRASIPSYNQFVIERTVPSDGMRRAREWESVAIVPTNMEHVVKTNMAALGTLRTTCQYTSTLDVHRVWGGGCIADFA